MPVELPKTAATALPTEQEEPLTITLTSDGRTMIQNTEIDVVELIPPCGPLRRNGPATRCSCEPTGLFPMSVWRS